MGTRLTEEQFIRRLTFFVCLRDPDARMWVCPKAACERTMAGTSRKVLRSQNSWRKLGARTQKPVGSDPPDAPVRPRMFAENRSNLSCALCFFVVCSAAPQSSLLKSVHHAPPEPKGTSSNGRIFPANSPKPEHAQFSTI